MRAFVSIGENDTYTLRNAILVYAGQSGRGAFSMVHPIRAAENGGAPVYGDGKQVTERFLAELSTSLSEHVAPEVLPEHVLWRQPGLILWWTPACIRPMFFRTRDDAEMNALSGRDFPQPPLVWRLTGGTLALFALRESRRPTAETPLYLAPYYNVDRDGGAVCQGSMPRPDRSTAETCLDWGASFYGSSFTHAWTSTRSIGRPYKDVTQLWKKMAGRKRFPLSSLVAARRTVGDLLRPRGRT